MTGALATTLFVVGIVVAIMIHEWGHFASARRFGMRVDRFFLGFGPTLWSTRRGETEYGVKALPLGGFVRIKGMSPEDVRLRPVADALFDPEALAADQRAAAADGDGSVHVPTLTDRTYARLRTILDERGADAELSERLVNVLRHEVGGDATVAEARTALERAIDAHVPSTGRLGDLHHRLRHGDRERFFGDRPAWQRAIVLASGSFMHFVQAVALLFLIFWLSGPVMVLPVVDQVAEDSPASAAGFEPGDRILAVDGIEAEEFERIRELIQQRAGETTEFTVDRDGELLAIEATPAEVTTETGEVVGQLGFAPLVDNQPLPVGEAAARTVVGEGSVSDLTVRTLSLMGDVFGPDGIGSIFSQVAGEEERASEGAVSMVGAGRLAAEGARDFGLLLILGTLLASINIFVGIFNLLPLPPLDGGHLAVLGVERSVNGVRRLLGRPADFSVDPRAVAAIAVPVIALIGTISLALLWLDIVNPVHLGN